MTTFLAAIIRILDLAIPPVSGPQAEIDAKFDAIIAAYDNPAD